MGKNGDDLEQEQLEFARGTGNKLIAGSGIITVERYYLKAMNCPHHHRIFAAEPRSYRDCRCAWRSTAPAIATSRGASCSA